MPADHREVFLAIHREVVWLCSFWTTYRQLFELKATVKLLNDSASSVFRVMQITLHDSILLRITRLTDPKETAGHKHLTLQRLTDIAEAEKAIAKRESDEFKAATRLVRHSKKAIKEIDTATHAIRNHRVSRIAHADLGVSLKSVTLPDVKHAEIGKVIEKICGLVNRYHAHYRDNSVVGYGGRWLADDGQTVLNVLAYGLRMLDVQDQVWQLDVIEDHDRPKAIEELLKSLHRDVSVPHVPDGLIVPDGDTDMGA